MVNRNRYFKNKGRKPVVGPQNNPSHEAALAPLQEFLKRSRSSTPILTVYNENSCIAKAFLNASKVANQMHSNSDPSYGQSSDTQPNNQSNSSRVELYENLSSKGDSEGNQQVGTCARCAEMKENFLKFEETAPDDWQTGLLTPSQRLGDLYNYGHLADVVITFPDTDVTYKAHRLMLAMASPVFEKMFYGRGSTKESQIGEVCLHECSPDAVKWLLDNLYVGKISFTYVQEALSVYSLAQMYQILGVVELAKEFLKQELSINNVSQVYTVARTHSEEYLLEACLKKISTEWKDLKGERFSSITEDLWMFLLRSPVLPISEVNLCKSLVQWGKQNLEQERGKVWPGLIREKIQKFIPYLRLCAISPDRFIDEIIPLKIFTSDEVSFLLMRIRGQSLNLPPKLQCDEVSHSRILLTEDTLKFAVLSRPVDYRRMGATTAEKITFIDFFSVSFPVLLSQIQANENHTLRDSQMSITESNGKVVGVAKPVNSLWRFSQSVYIYPNKTYKVEIDRALVSGRTVTRREFNIHSNDVKFKGVAYDHYFRLYYWAAHARDY